MKHSLPFSVERSSKGSHEHAARQQRDEAGHPQGRDGDFLLHEDQQVRPADGRGQNGEAVPVWVWVEKSAPPKEEKAKGV